MSNRLQKLNDDTILEVTEMVAKRTRHSEKELMIRKEYFESMILKCQAGLEEVNALLATIENERKI